jgi:prophage regulatory protein
MKLVIRPSEIKEYTGLSKNSAFRLEKEGKFPARIQLGPSAVGWRYEDLREWLESRPVIGAGNVREVAVGGHRGRPKGSKNKNAA